jgi:hypothetical protein
MPVRLGPGYSIIVRKDSMARIGVTNQMIVGTVADLVSEDDALLVLGPLYEPGDAGNKLRGLGLEYFEDYFDLPHSGGPVPEWCEIELRMRR